MQGVFRVCNILADGGFECVRNSLADMGITLNVTSRNEHIPEVKSYIRTIKKRFRAKCFTFQEIPTKANCQNGIQHRVLVIHIPTIGWCTYNNQPKDTNNGAGNRLS